MWSRTQVELTIRQSIVECFRLDHISPDSIPLDEAGFLPALGANSIDTLNLMLSIEERFGFQFEDGRLRADLLLTLDDLVTQTCRHIDRIDRPVAARLSIESTAT